MELVMPPSANDACTPCLIMPSRRKRVTASEAPPVPVWKENPSLKYGEAIMTLAAYSAMMSSLGFLVKRVAPFAMPLGSPMASTFTT